MKQERVAAATAAVFVGGVRQGTAVLIAEEQVLTARHLVARLQEGSWTPIDAPITLEFPGRKWRFECEVITESVGAADIAVLRLSTDDAGSELPEPVPLSPVRRLPNHVSVLGYPKSEGVVEGVWRNFDVGGPTTSGLVQLRWDEGAGTLPGHSGGPVIDPDAGTILGVLVQGSAEGRFDRFAPLTSLESVWPNLRRPWCFVGSDARWHFHRRALGQQSRAHGRDLFEGRAAVLRVVAAWLEEQRHPMLPLVITGQPGSGKSAVLGRAAIIGESESPVHGLVFYARDSTVSAFVEAVAAFLGIDRTPESVDELVGLLGEESDLPSCSLLIDALDEAASKHDRLEIARAAAELSTLPMLRVVVATRPLSGAYPVSVGPLLGALLVSTFESRNLVDLDGDIYGDGPAVEQFAASVLVLEASPDCAAEIYRQDPVLTAEVARLIAERAHGNFLVAALTAGTLSLSSEPLVLGAEGTGPRLPASIGEALDKYVVSLPDSRRLKTQALLGALAYARGEGVVETIWLRFAEALGYPSTRRDLDELLDSASADYLIQTTNSGSEIVYRLFHQALVDQMQETRGGPGHQLVFRALLDDVTAAGGWERASPYARTHAADHARSANELNNLVRDLEYVQYADLGRLLSAINVVGQEDHSEIFDVIRQTAHLASTLTPEERVQVFALAAAMNHAGSAMARNLAEQSTGGLFEVAWAHSLGTNHQRLRGHRGRLTGVAIGTFDGADVVVSASSSDGVRLWDRDGSPVGSSIGDESGRVTAMALGAIRGRNAIVTGHVDGRVRLWYSSAVAPVEEFMLPDGQGVQSLAVGVLDGYDVVVAIGADHVLWTWNVDLQEQKTTVIADVQTVNCLAIGAVAGRSVIVTGSDVMLPHQSLRFWNRSAEPVLDVRRPYVGWVQAITFVELEGDSRLVTAGSRGSVDIWNVDTTAVDATMTGHQDWVRALCSLKVDGSFWIASGGDDATIRLWDAAVGLQIGEPFVGHPDHVASLATGRLGQRDLLASVGQWEGVVRLWDAKPAPKTSAHDGHVGSISTVAVGTWHGDQVVVSGGEDRSVRIWNLNGDRLSPPLTGPTRSVLSVAGGFIEDTEVVVAGSRDGGVWLWRGDFNGPAVRLGDHSDWVRRVRVAKIWDLETVISAGDDRVVHFWGLDGRQLLPTIGPLDDWVMDVVWGPVDGSDVLFTAEDMGTICAWNQDLTLRWKVDDAHLTGISSLWFGEISGTNHLISAGADGFVHFWTPDGQRVGRWSRDLGQPCSGVDVLQVDGHTVVVAAGGRGVVRGWFVDRDPSGEPFYLLESAVAMTAAAERLVVATGGAMLGMSLLAPKSP